MNQFAIGWIALAIALVVFLDLLFVEVRRAVREAKRIVTRISAYADLPVLAQAARVGTDVDRIAFAADRIAPLLERGRAAIAAIREPRAAAQRYGSLVPNGPEASNGFSVVE